MYAVIATGGKQERVEVGSRIEVELLAAATGEEVNFAPVLLVDESGVVSLPADLAKAVVAGRVVGESKGPKITGFTYKAKARGRRRYGHRQHYSTVEITKIAKTKTAAKAKA
ncbi:MAG TPA: 50S ribosomal protein L21 [Acidimicrobiales bacterium]|nr:50S ribosomal protein L21 [Acidimicrobiales bacterium]